MSLPSITNLPLSIGLRIPNESGLEALIKAQSDIRSPEFHHYLTPAQFTNTFSPSTEQVKAVAQYLQSSGILVSSVSSNRLLMKASASVATVERAFHVTLVYFSLGKRTVFAPTTEPSVPSALAPIILNIGGLDDVAQIHPFNQSTKAIKQSTPPSLGHRKGPHDPSQCAYVTYPGYTPTQLESAYDISPLTSAGYQGNGQTIALLELSGFVHNDITVFQTSCLGATGTQLNNYSVYPVNYPGEYPMDQHTSEVELDMDVLQGIAPYAQEIVFEGPNIFYQGYDEVMNTIVNYSPPPQVVSISWGDCESNTTQSELMTDHNMYAQGASEGMAIFAASGDDGGRCDGLSIGVATPGDDPLVVGVGGTILQTNPPNATYNSELGWYSSDGGVSGNHTDCSIFYFAQPWYQTGLGVDATGTNPCGARQVPDVSAQASISDAYSPTGYEIYCTASTDSKCSPQGYIISGATSAASPLWAAIAADTNQYLIAAGKQPLGWPNALLYQMFNSKQPYTAYHDVVGNTNVANYQATTGYDMVTGIGSPDAWNLARDVVTNRIGSDVFWGATNSSGSTEMLNDTFQFSGLSQQHQQANVSQALRNAGNTIPNLATQAGKPGVISYTDVNGHPITSAFAYLNNGQIGEFVHDLSVNESTWAFVPINAAYGQTVYNPSAISSVSGSNVFIGLFGITSGGQLVEYFHSGSSSNPWSQNNLSSLTGVTCDAHIAPAALLYPGGTTEVFADCSSKLTQFFYSSGAWHVSQVFSGGNPLNIPNASESFPGHSISAAAVATNSPAMAVFVASDRNGVNALSEALYSSSGGWSTYGLPSSGYVADQVTANILQLSSTGSASEVFVTSPSSGACISTTIQYVYQPANPTWNTTTQPLGEVTDAQTVALPGGVAYSQADSGDYTGTSTRGAAGGGACTSYSSISVGYSYLTTANTQGWQWPAIVSNGGYPGDNAGVDPAGAIFNY